MKITIELESEQAGRGLFYWLLAKSGSNSLPLKSASQWFYDVGKALYELSEEEATEALQALRDTRQVSVITKKDQL